MKYLLLSFVFATALHAATASAGMVFITSSSDDGGGGKLSRLISATEQDYWSLKFSFSDAYNTGITSWDTYRENTGFDVKMVEQRIMDRIDTLEKISKTVNTIFPEKMRNETNNIIASLESANMTLLSLIEDDDGYGQCISSRDDATRDNINLWHEGVRISLEDTKRSMFAGRATAGDTRSALLTDSSQ